MRMHALLLLGLLSATSSVAAEVPLERHSLGSWEADIGYAGVVRDGDTPHISGVACEGADMQAAVQACYRELAGILQRFGADSSQVVKETLYTTDMDALIPFGEALEAAAGEGKSLEEAWAAAAEVAQKAAEDTATMVPKVGRARPAAERSLGTPDAGAVSMALCIRTVLPG